MLLVCLAASTACVRDSNPPHDGASVAPWVGGTAAPAPSSRPERRLAFRSSRGRWRGASWGAVWVDPRQAHVDLLVFGRRGDAWTPAYATVEQLPSSWTAAINGTFFSLRHCEPVGILVYDNGRRTWTPRVKRWYGAVERPVAKLDRGYLAVLDDGTACIGSSSGRTAPEQSAIVARERGQRVRCLLGGGGPLVSHGRVAVSAASLARAGFDERSGLRESEPLRRCGVGLTVDGRILLLTCGLEGGGLSLRDFATLFVRQGARQAIFLDCGSSTAMRQDSGWATGGRPVPVWLVAGRR